MRVYNSCVLMAVAATMAAVLAVISVSPVSAGEVTVGGWAGVVLTDNDKDGSLPYFDAHPWYIYVKAEPVDGWRFFGEVEAEHIFKFEAGKEGSGEFKLERLYIEHNLNTKHNLRAGKMFMPFGYWYQLHWHFLTETLSRPIAFNNAYVPRQNVGLQYFGKVYRGDMSVDYNLWIGNGPDVFGTDERTIDTFGSGGSFFASRKLGGSYSRTIGLAGGYHAQTVRRTGDLIRENQENIVAAMECRFDGFETRFEHYWHTFTGREDLRSWYANGMYWFVSEMAVNFRYEQGDDLKGTGDDLRPEATVKSFALVYRPEAAILIKAEYRINHFENPADKGFNEWNVYLAMKY